MNILVDTHIALWSITDTKRLNADMRSILETQENSFYYSVISVWEIALKHNTHPEKMEISEEEFEHLCQETGFKQLELLSSHIYAVKNLIWKGSGKEHMDPFDRILLSQAIVEDMKFMTADTIIPNFKQDCVIPV